jgi:hypothetical protein
VPGVDAILKQLDALMMRHSGFLEWKEPPAGQLIGLLTSAQAAIERLAPPNTSYRVRCQATLQDEFSGDSDKLERLIGIVDALRADYRAGALAPIQDLVRAEVFDDFMVMAEHLLENGYKDGAAVLVGGILEQTLRRLCGRAGIATDKEGIRKKTDALNSELAAQGIYGKLDQKSVTSWLDLRNKAAHGEYDRYTSEQVRTLLIGVREFARRVGG